MPDMDSITDNGAPCLPKERHVILAYSSLIYIIFNIIITYLLLLLRLLLFLCESYFHDLPEEGQCPQYHDGIANHAKPTQIL